MELEGQQEGQLQRPQPHPQQHQVQQQQQLHQMHQQQPQQQPQQIPVVAVTSGTSTPTVTPLVNEPAAASSLAAAGLTAAQVVTGWAKEAALASAQARGASEGGASDSAVRSSEQGAARQVSARSANGTAAETDQIWSGRRGEAASPSRLGADSSSPSPIVAPPTARLRAWVAPVPRYTLQAQRQGNVWHVPLPSTEGSEEERWMRIATSLQMEGAATGEHGVKVEAGAEAGAAQTLAEAAEILAADPPTLDEYVI